MSIKRIGILTGGGDAPGLNAVIRAVTVKGLDSGYEIIGFEGGWRGLMEKKYRTLTLKDVEDIHLEGGTVLHSSRTNVAKIENGFEIARKHLQETEVDALVAAGGEDTLGVALKLFQSGANVVGVPKTIDNDVDATDYTSHSGFYSKFNPKPDGVLLAFGSLGDQHQAQKDFEHARHLIETNFLGALSILETIAADFEKFTNGTVTMLEVMFPNKPN